MYVRPTTIYGSLIPGSEYIRSLVRQGTMSKDAANRAKWFDYYAACLNARKTCRRFGISAQTFYRWKRRFDPWDLTTLEGASCRPHRVRKPETRPEVEEKIRQLREQYPDEVRFQFSARDTVTRFDALRAYKRQTSTAGADFVHYLRKKFPFPIKAIQIDGGSEFRDQFEEACRGKKILLFELPRSSPKLNGRVERANRTHREEFYEVYDIDLSLEEHNRQL